MRSIPQNSNILQRYLLKWARILDFRTRIEKSGSCRPLLYWNTSNMTWTKLHSRKSCFHDYAFSNGNAYIYFFVLFFGKWFFHNYLHATCDWLFLTKLLQYSLLTHPFKLNFCFIFATYFKISPFHGQNWVHVHKNEAWKNGNK